MSIVTLIRRFLKDMTTTELLDWPLSYEQELKAHQVFQDTPHEGYGQARHTTQAVLFFSGFCEEAERNGGQH